MVEKPEWIAKSEMELLNGIFPKKDLESLFKSKTRDEWASLSKDNDNCLSPILELEEVIQHNHIQERKVFKESTIKDITIKTYNAPFKTYS